MAAVLLVAQNLHQLLELSEHGSAVSFELTTVVSWFRAHGSSLGSTGPVKCASHDGTEVPQSGNTKGGGPV